MRISVIRIDSVLPFFLIHFAWASEFLLLIQAKNIAMYREISGLFE